MGKATKPKATKPKTTKPKKVTTKPKKAGYRLGAKGSLKCPVGTGKVSSKSECDAAAKLAGKKSRKNLSKNANYPNECFKYSNGNFYFNTHSSGKSHKSAEVVCKTGK